MELPIERIEEFRGRYRFLSNFFSCRVVFDNTVYSSVEHAYQAAKTVDPVDRETIRNMPTAGLAKRAGGRVTLRPTWEVVKLDVMLALLANKFSEPWLRYKLLQTIPKVLIEGNTWHDGFWGDCRCGRCDKGQNRLGVLLMQVRDHIRNRKQ